MAWFLHQLFENQTRRKFYLLVHFYQLFTRILSCINELIAATFGRAWSQTVTTTIRPMCSNLPITSFKCLAISALPQTSICEKVTDGLLPLTSYPFDYENKCLFNENGLSFRISILEAQNWICLPIVCQTCWQEHLIHHKHAESIETVKLANWLGKIFHNSITNTKTE